MSITQKLAATAILLLTLFCAGTAQASVEQARNFVTHLSDTTLSIIQNATLPSEEKEKELTALFTKTIDTEWIGKFALGRYIRTLTPEQKERYRTLYTQFLILNYVPNFRDYTGQTLKIVAITESGQNTYLAQTEIVSPDGGNIRVDYRLRQKDDAFTIYDIIAEGVSLIATQRSEFGSILAQQGVDALLDKLEERIKTGSAATVSAAK